MQIVHVSTTDYGGAYIAAKRISESLNDNEVISRVIVRTKSKKGGDDREVINNFLKKFISKTKNAFNLLLSDEIITIDFFGTNICKCEDIRDADVIVLHWVNSFVSFRIAKKLVALNKPVIWVMHDMWPFTGGCHYDMECGKYESNCVNCEMAKCTITRVLAKYSKKHKNEIFCSKNVTLVGPSKWITECARKSFGNSCNIVNIPNPIDTSHFKPKSNRWQIREKYGFDLERPIVLFAAMDVTDRRKGFDIINEILRKMNNCDIQLCVLGKNDESFGDDINCTYLGFVCDEQELIDVYSMADVFVTPSRQENLSNAVLEAMSCGLPVVAFDIGGMPDMIAHKKSGYLAMPFDSEDFKDGIVFCLENASTLGKHARENMQIHFDRNIISSKYNELVGKK